MQFHLRKQSHPAKDRKRMDGEYCHTCQCYVLVKHVLDAEIHRTWAARASSSVSTSYEILYVIYKLTCKNLYWQDIVPLLRRNIYHRDTILKYGHVRWSPYIPSQWFDIHSYHNTLNFTCKYIHVTSNYGREQTQGSCVTSIQCVVTEY